MYSDPHAAPEVVPVADLPLSEDGWAQLARVLATRAHDLARHRGGADPLAVFQELVDNLVHASFAGVVVTILDNGNTLRVSDRGPGIPDKEAALRPGFTSAGAEARRSIRGVGSGFSVVSRDTRGLDGILEIDDNLGRGTVVTARVRPQADIPLAPTAFPTYNLTERQLRTLLLTVELAPVGPTRVAQELGVSTSTAYRDLVYLGGGGLRHLWGGRASLGHRRRAGVSERRATSGDTWHLTHGVPSDNGDVTRWRERAAILSGSRPWTSSLNRSTRAHTASGSSPPSVSASTTGSTRSGWPPTSPVTGSTPAFARSWPTRSRRWSGSPSRSVSSCRRR